MELLLVRHALPQRIELAEGAADPSLSDVGREQAERLADYLASEGIDAVYSSPRRCAEVLGLPIDRRGFHYPNDTSVHRVAASRSGVRTIVTVDETPHLRHAGLPMGLVQKG